jgi:hypothetical protein
MILSIGIDNRREPDNGNLRAARKLLCRIDGPLDSHEPSRAPLAKSREFPRPA